MAMRGADKKKHKEALEEGTLKLPVRKLPMAGAVQTWRQACGQSDRWDASFNAKAIEEKPLKIIKCPECKVGHEAMSLKLKVKFGFGNLTCKVAEK